MKLAIIHDHLLIKGGAERIFLYMAEEFPEADIFTLAYNPETTLPEFKNFKVHTSWANRFIQTPGIAKTFFPISSYIMKYWDFRPYDIILSSSSNVAKYVERFKGIHICYCYYPTRFIWATEQYLGESDSIKAMIIRQLSSIFKLRDYAVAQRVHKFIAISEVSRAAIGQCYNRDSEVLYCPVDVNRFHQDNHERKEDFYLIVSRFEKWKRVDYAIEAFNRLGFPLKIIGGGSEEPALKAMAEKNIEFLGIVDDDALVSFYNRARAVIFTPKLEYGLIPLEANSTGTPVIAFGIGGIQETMVPVNGFRPKGKSPTAVFFYEQTPEALIEAVRIFEKYEFNREALVRHAQEFGIPFFKQRLRRIIENAARNAP